MKVDINVFRSRSKRGGGNCYHGHQSDLRYGVDYLWFYNEVKMEGIARPQINWASDPSRSHDMALVYIGIR